jgi:glycosyltransferase involved in cell wall biosynthesis
MHILLLAEGNPETWDSWSGSARSLLRALRALGHRVTAADVSERRLGRWADLARSWVPNRRRWVARYHLGSFGFQRRTNRARALLAQHGGQFDAVLQIGATFNALRWTDRPGFVYCDANAILAGRDAPGGEVAALLPSERDAVLTHEKAVYTQASTVFAMSEYLRRSFISDFGVPAHAVQTVFAGANLDVDALPPLTGTFDRPPTVLFVGKQWERKGGPLLLQAFRGVRRAIPDARLVIVGCTPAIPADASDGVEIVGPVVKDSANGQATLSALYQRADVFCMPSQFEPFGVVFIEAMLHGLPCVGTDRCAIPEIIATGETGWLVPAADARQLGDTLIGALSQRGALGDIGRRCRERALRLFTWERVAERVLDVMSRYVAGSSVGVRN